MLHKIVEGVSNESARSFSSRARLSLFEFNQLLTNHLIREAKALSSSRFNRRDIIQQIKEKLENSLFFEKVPIQEGQTSEQEAEKFILKIEFEPNQKITLKEKFIEMLAQNDTLKSFHKQGIDSPEEWAKDQLKLALYKISEIYQEIQISHLDSISGLFKQSHHESWLKTQLEEIHHEFYDRHQNADRLIFILINPRSFSSVNDYFASHEIGNEVLKEMGNSLKKIRHHLKKSLDLDYKDVGIHRLKGVNFSISLRVKSDKELNLEKLEKKIVRLMKTNKMLVKFKWNIPQVKTMSDESILEIIRELLHHKGKNNGKISLEKVKRYRKGDTERKDPIAGITSNLGHYEYQPSDGFLSAKQLSQRLDNSLIDLNRKNPDQMVLDYQSSDIHYSEELMLGGIEHYKEEQSKIDRINQILIQRKYYENIIDKKLWHRKLQRISSYDGLRKLLYEHLNIVFEKSNFYIKALTLENLPQEVKNELTFYKPVYRYEGDWYLPVIDHQGKEFVFFKVSKESIGRMKMSEKVLLLKTVNSFDHVLEDFQRSSNLDPLTNLPKNEKLIMDINELLDQKKSFSVSFMDHNSFSGYGATFGERAGDFILRESSKIFNQKITEQNAKFYRLSEGEEFTVLAENNKQALKISSDLARLCVLWNKSKEKLFLYPVSWNEIKSNLFLFYLSKDRAIKITSQQYDHILEEIWPSYMNQIMNQLDNETFDPNKKYVIDLNRTKRYVPKKRILISGFSVSMGVFDVYAETKNGPSWIINKADTYSNEAKKYYDLKQKSFSHSVPSVIFTQEGYYDWTLDQPFPEE